MKTTELETLIADYRNVSDIDVFTVRPSVEALPDGNNGDIRRTTTDNHYHLYHNGWVDLGTADDERMDKVDELIQDVQDMELGEYIKRAEAQEVISDLTEEIFVPMSDEDINNILGGA